MRSDAGLGLESVEDLPGQSVPGRFFEDGVSQSGRERNHFFANLGSEFADLSGVSGLDHPADGRAFAWLDYDRDGWLDLAVVNANAPLFQLYRNEMESLPGVGEREFLIVELEGAGAGSTPSPGEHGGGRVSTRDAIGARVELRLGDGRKLVREKRAGEGLAAQNSARLHFGLGPSPGETLALEVRWPSGRRQQLEGVKPGVLLRIREGEPAVELAYRSAAESERASGLAKRSGGAGEPPVFPKAGEPLAALRVLTSFATWCEVCLGELPQIADLRARFSEKELALEGIPVDPKDTPGKLERWQARHRPAYRVRNDWSAEERAAFQAWIRERLRSDGLPSTVLTNARGEILSTRYGVPTVSEIAGWLDREGRVDASASD